jgi:protease-4
MLALLVLLLVGSVLFNAILLMALAVTVVDTDRRVEEKFYSHNSAAVDKVAILSLEGVILDGEGFAKREIDRVRKDKNVKAVVLRVDSPGGSVAASDFLYHYLRKMTEDRKIPLVVSMGSVAASGGYYVSMAVGNTPRSIFAEPATWTGSIGVIIPHYNMTGLLNQIGVKEDSIASHPLKTMGSFTKPMSDEERQVFQGLVTESFDRFKEIVRAGRPRFKADPKALDKLATGQIFTSNQALKNGLIDEVGFLDNAITRAIELAKLDPNNVKVVKYKPETTLINSLMGGEVRSRVPDLAALLDMSAPRAFYLYTTLPPLMTLPKP